MDFRGDERGQAGQVGAVLLLVVLVASLSYYQASVVPDQNRRVEFTHYVDAGGDVTELRNALLRAAASNEVAGQSVSIGTSYPDRAFFVNPPPPTGRLVTGAVRNVTFGNVTAVSGAPANVRAYWSGAAKNVATAPVTFRPGYHLIDAPPVTTQYGLTYRRYASPVTLADQTLVRGNRLTLVAVRGDVDASGYTAAVTAVPLSAHVRTVSVTNASDGNVTITVPTALDAAAWERALAGQIDAPGGADHPTRYVTSVRAGPRPDTVTVELEPGKTYELRLALVGLVAESDALAVDDPPAEYVVRASERTVAAGSDGRARLVVEARDRFDNPVSGANVTFSASAGDFEQADGDPVSFPVRTGEDGRATVYLNVTGAYGKTAATAYLGPTADDSLPTRQRTTFEVLNAGGSGSDAASSYVVLADASPSNAQGGQYRNVTYELRYTGTVPLDVTGVRLGYATQFDSQSISDGPDGIVAVTLRGDSRAISASENSGPWFFAEHGQAPLSLAAGDAAQPQTMTVELDAGFLVEKDKESMPITVTLYFEGGGSATYAVWLGT